MQINNILSRWQLVPLTFAQDAVAASQTAVALFTTDANNSCCLNLAYTMPFAGEIVGVSGNIDTAGTAGTLKVIPTIATVVVTDPIATFSTAAYASDTCRRGTNVFAANALIGCKITSSAAWNGTSSDLNAIVWVLLKIDAI